MIFKILKLIIFIFIIWYLSEFFSERPGVTSINWMEWGIQIPTDRFILIIILFSVILIFIDRIWLAFLNLPKATFRRFEANNNKKVEQKLVKAFLLASHGELETAAKEAALVSRNTKDKNLGINVWTVNNIPALEWCRDKKVDGIITDLGVIK